MTNLTDIATTIRKHSPGVLPESVFTPTADFPNSLWCHTTRWNYQLPDSIAEAVLRDAMVRDAEGLYRSEGCWEMPQFGRAEGPDYFVALDSDHGGSLGACYAAWRWSKGIA